MGSESQHDCVTEGIFSCEEGGVSFRIPDKNDRVAVLAKLHHGVERLEQGRTLWDEAVVEVNHAHEFLDLGGRLRKLLDSFSPLVELSDDFWDKSVAKEAEGSIS